MQKRTMKRTKITDLDHHEEHDQAHDHPPIGTVTAVLAGLSSLLRHYR